MNKSGQNSAIKSKELDRISVEAPHTQGVMVTATEYCWSIFQRYFKGTEVLELGPAEGVMTKLLSRQGFNIIAVEGSARAAQNLRLEYPDIAVVHALFEDFEPDGKFDMIILGHVLEHVDDPGLLLRRCRKWLKPKHGKVFASVPNANSLHRQVAVHMGLLAHPSCLNESDVAHGHQRVFGYRDFLSLFIDNGYSVHMQGGYWLKPVSNAQIEAWFTPEMLNAFMVAGETYPEIAGEIYVIAS